MPTRPIVSADGVGGVHALPGWRRYRSAPPPNRLHPGAAGSVLRANERQPIPISTAILIRSEWFLAPSFCLSSDVVLATVL